MRPLMVCLLHGAVQTAIDLPWSLYNIFVLEQRHGFNKTTPQTFVMDMLKTVRTLLVFPLFLSPVLLLMLCQWCALV